MACLPLPIHYSVDKEGRQEIKAPWQIITKNKMNQKSHDILINMIQTIHPTINLCSDPQMQLVHSDKIFFKLHENKKTWLSQDFRIRKKLGNHGSYVSYLILTYYPVTVSRS